MRPQTLPLATLTLLFSSILAAAPQQSIVQSDSQALLLAQRALNLLSGGTAISDVTLAGTATRIAGSDNESGTVVLKALASGQSRMDLSLPSGTRSELRAVASDGSPAGEWSGPDGTPLPITNHNLWAPSAWFFPALTLQAAASAGYVVSYIGQEASNGAAVQHLSLFQQADGTPNAVASIRRLSQVDVYLDAATLLPAALTFNLHPDQNSGLDIPVELRFSDYRAVNGAQVPFRVRKFIQNSLVLDLQIQTVSLNSGLSAAAFSLQ